MSTSRVPGDQGTAPFVPALAFAALTPLYDAATCGTARLVAAYAQRLPFDDASFDLVVSTLVFHHLDDATKRRALGEIRRVLCNGGRLMLADFGPARSAVGGLLLRVGSLFDGRANMRAHLAGELPGMLRDAGFAEVHEPAAPYRGVHVLRAVAGPPAG